MDKKEKKRDIASFSSNLKDLMNAPLDKPLSTFDRDIQHFIYGRIALLIKHNEGAAIGSLNDVGAVTGAALSSVLTAFIQNGSDNSSIEEIFSSVRESMILGFNARVPSLEVESESSDETSVATEDLISD